MSGCMETTRITSPLLRAVLGMMFFVWTISGWYFIATCSFSTRPRRVPIETTVEGWGAVFMGGLLVLLGVISLLALLQGTDANRLKTVALVALTIAIPAVFVFVA